ncbi:rod shape-determining protein RodA [Anabaena cylindrica FACHB-243]|uniref:Peptidoglycan glycosyltransferase RodA n=1 Tax=Anabaena cylindrica (strain ATCC 27899 / PCC 7122) TaxID=272123 RepID=K9ZIT1_ANACC|nr:MULTISPECIES: rod shape-determining protein RodA [Anabaena]AFZ59143.1 rod shape-determining protein RodA [Anabaena cylindrica PCC 7122]MBD2416494.1 rod shape-determining protein RodA [Anabaena cylindrica FACHB-243]MBY5281066.1 rod shape-determining protein RodA [Anabaena sp. CCAP 1446/1C]MBY5309853.1 rod shape-determining protein RodA [Anabaena sp. CCAP 1446/1C]MCM2407431.1 rod shape-determining protein RodA [Anabaena sp. CCAP 1446/1C]
MLLKPSLPKIRWQYWIKPWQQVDWLLFFLPVAASMFGGLMILSTELKQPVTDWWWHWLVAGIGSLIALFLARCRYENLMQWHWITYALTNFSLVIVMVAGTSAKGAQRWISIGSFNVQPSEFAKIGVIITLAALLHRRTASTLESVFRILAITAVPWGLIFLQPDLATSLVFGSIVLGMLYWANANPGWLILMISPVVSAILFSISWPLSEPIVLIKELSLSPLGLFWAGAMGILGWQTLPWKRFNMGAIASFSLNMLGGELGLFAWNHVLKEYQKDRLSVFINPEHDPLGAGYHLIQSRIAIGAGEVWGWGLFKGPMTQLNFVPEQHTDFIFSAVGEEFGFVGCLIVLFVFCLICFRILHVAQSAKDNFGSLLAIGVLSMIVFQLIVNVGMTVGLAPVAGIPLPWMSYGRSAMLTNFIALGIVESVANFRQRPKYY